MITEIERLRRLTFEDTLALWPYRSMGRPASEVAALDYCHKLRMTYPGLTVKERNTSLRHLQSKGYYPWVKPFEEEKPDPIVTKVHKAVKAAARRKRK